MTREQFRPRFLDQNQGLGDRTGRTGQTRTQIYYSLLIGCGARFGNAGQVDYAMANEMLNRAAWSLKAASP